MVRRMFDTGFNAAGSVLDMQVLLDEVAKPTHAAVDTPLPAPPPPVGDVVTPATGGGFRIIPKDDAPAAETKQDEPMFTRPADQQEPDKKRASLSSDADTVEEVVFEDLLEMRNYLQGKLLAWFAGNSKQAHKYMLDEDAMNLLVKAYKPYANRMKGKIPPWIMVLAMELTTIIPLVEQAKEDRAANMRNKKAIQAAKDAETKQQQQQPAVQQIATAGANVVPLVPTPQKPAVVVNNNLQRTRFKIHSDGSYCYGREGDPAYYNKGDNEKVNLQNVEEVKAVIKANGYRKGWEKLQKAFNLPDSFLITTGIGAELENID